VLLTFGIFSDEENQQCGLEGFAPIAAGKSGNKLC
jgi:hypothetical protein